MPKFYEKLSELLSTHSRLALATVVETQGSTPREVGAKMIILPNDEIFGTLGGGKLELLVMQDANKALQQGESVLKEYSLHEEDQGGIGAICGGSATVFIEIIKRGERLVILGGGHIGLALYKLAIETGFGVVIVDARPEFAQKGKFPEAELVLNCNVDDPKVKQIVDKNTYIVIVTHEHTQDKLAVKSLIDLEPKYLGMIGSKNKVKQTLDELESEGVPKEKLIKIYSPIGLDIKAETPAEIAVSILAELVQVRRTGKPSKISLKNHTNLGKD